MVPNTSTPSLGSNTIGCTLGGITGKEVGWKTELQLSKLARDKQADGFLSKTLKIMKYSWNS